MARTPGPLAAQVPEANHRCAIEHKQRRKWRRALCLSKKVAAADHFGGRQPLLWVEAQEKCHVSSLVAEERDAVVATRLPIGGSDSGDFPREVALNCFCFQG